MSPPPLLAVHDLTWSPPDEASDFLFDSFDMTLRPGERVVLEGPSGAGKSTLLRCLVGLEDRDAGTLLWRGDPVRGDDLRRLRRRVAYLQQEPVDIAGTIADNLAFAREMGESGRDDRSSAPLGEPEQRELMAEFGLDAIDWDRDFSGLSVGERQRVAFVRTLTGQPDVLLLDEPTAALDESRARQIERHVVDYVEAEPGRACIWVSHAPDLADRIATRVLEVVPD